jgi:transposase
LTYKALLKGKRVETVSPSYTSQIDCMTSKRDGQRKGCRYYSSSGVIYDADWNAAINIRNRKHSTSSRVPLDGTLDLVDRLQSISQK